jgi:hypothetical protein
MSDKFIRTAGMSVTDEEYKIINEMRSKDGSIRSVSQVLRDIIIPIIMNGNENVSPPTIETESENNSGELSIPAAKQQFNGNENVSPLTIETKSEDDSQNETQDGEHSKQGTWGEDINFDV